MNRTTLCLLTALLPGVGLAAPAMATMWPGFYVGANASVTTTTIKNQLRFNSLDIIDADLYFRNQYGSTTQVQPGFIVGYEHMFQKRWMLSGEIQMNILKSYVNLSGTDYVSNVFTASNQFALQVRGGYNLTENDNTIYALLGVASTRANAKIIFDNTNMVQGALGDLQLDPLDATHTQTGVKFGVGYEKHINEHLGIRVDYSHTCYGNFNSALTDKTFDDIMITNESGLSKISQSTDMLGFTLILLA